MQYAITRDLDKDSWVVKKCAAPKSHGEKRYEIKSSSQEMVG